MAMAFFALCALALGIVAIGLVYLLLKLVFQLVMLLCWGTVALAGSASLMLEGLREEDRFVAQARREQATAKYPGCEEGYLNCLDQTCGCDERRPCEAFVRARAMMLRRGAS